MGAGSARRLPRLRSRHANTLMFTSRLILAQESRGRWAEAEALRRGLVAQRRKTVPLDMRVLAGELAGLGRNLLEQESWAKAETVLRESLAIRETVLPDEGSRFNAMSQVGGALLGQRRYAEAEPLVVPGYEGLKARETKISAPAKPRLPEAAQRQ